ncbi:MAG: hypothetical protein H7Y00_11220 [Fimbriimonadaceae bacterium]|nr:hypothetical protein [Chitinophagales bacterium]
MIRNWQFILRTKLHVSGMTLFPFILVRKKELLQDKTFVNHEHIHLRQQLELCILPFYILYGLNYLLNRLKYKNHDTAYRNIIFEREAYRNEKDITYLKNRKFWNWIHYFS